MHGIDGKHRPVCLPCIEEPVPSPTLCGTASTPGARFMSIVRSMPGQTFEEMRMALGVPGWKADSRANDSASRALYRLVVSGRVERRGEWPHCTYWPASR